MENFHWSRAPRLFMIVSRRLLGFLVRSIGEDSSLLILPPPISILVYARFLSLLPLPRLILTIHVASPILYPSAPRPYSSVVVRQASHQLRMAERQFMSLVDFQKCDVFPYQPMTSFIASVSSFSHLSSWPLWVDGVGIISTPDLTSTTWPCQSFCSLGSRVS